MRNAVRMVVEMASSSAVALVLVLLPSSCFWSGIRPASISFRSSLSSWLMNSWYADIVTTNPGGTEMLPSRQRMERLWPLPPMVDRLEEAESSDRVNMLEIDFGS